MDSHAYVGWLTLQLIHDFPSKKGGGYSKRRPCIRLQVLNNKYLSYRYGLTFRPCSITFYLKSTEAGCAATDSTVTVLFSFLGEKIFKKIMGIY